MNRTEVGMLVEILKQEPASKWKAASEENVYTFDDVNFTFTLERIKLRGLPVTATHNSNYALRVYSSLDSSDPIETTIETYDDPEGHLRGLYGKVSSDVSKRISSQREEAIARFRRTYLE